MLRLLRTQAAVAGCARDVITERGPTMLAAMGAAIGMGGAPLPAGFEADLAALSTMLTNLLASTMSAESEFGGTVQMTHWSNLP